MAISKYSDDYLTKTAARVLSISRHINGTKAVKLEAGRRILASVLAASPKDLENRTDVAILKSAGEEAIKRAGGSGTYSNVPPSSTASNLPGKPGIGTPAVKDEDHPPSTMDQATCEAALEKSGITDPDFRQQTCSAYLEQQSGKDARAKSASVQNNSNYEPAAWLVARNQLFEGGSKRFEKEDKRISKGAAVIANSNEAPYWVKATSIEYRANNVPVSNAKELIKNASTMEDKRPAFIAGYLAKIHNM